MFPEWRATIIPLTISVKNKNCPLFPASTARMGKAQNAARAAPEEYRQRAAVRSQIAISPSPTGGAMPPTVPMAVATPFPP